MEGRGHAPGGLGGACVHAADCAGVPPICAGENTAIHGPLAAGMGALARQRASNTHAPPKPPAHGDRRPKRYHSAHSDLEVYITPPHPRTSCDTFPKIQPRNFPETPLGNGSGDGTIDAAASRKPQSPCPGATHGPTSPCFSVCCVRARRRRIRNVQELRGLDA